MSFDNRLDRDFRNGVYGEVRFLRREHMLGTENFMDCADSSGEVLEISRALHSFAGSSSAVRLSR